MDQTMELTRTEQTLLRSITRDDTRIDVVVPKDLDADKYWSVLGVVCKGVVRAEQAAGQLYPVLGRLLTVAQSNPSLYQDKGYETFEDFIAKIGESYRIGRSTCYKAKAIAERWGDQTAEIFGSVGRVKMELIHKAVGNGDEKKPYAKKLIEAAPTMTVEEFREHLNALPKAQGGLQRSETIGEVFEVRTTKKRAKFFREFFDDPAIQGFVGSGERELILEKCIEECAIEWRRQFEESQGAA